VTINKSLEIVITVFYIKKLSFQPLSGGAPKENLLPVHLKEKKN
jgi:hypothetical protein